MSKRQDIATFKSIAELRPIAHPMDELRPKPVGGPIDDLRPKPGKRQRDRHGRFTKMKYDRL